MAKFSIQRFIYTNPAKNADKFWHVKLNETQIQLWWGRNGTVGQSKVLNFDTKAQAYTEYNDRVAKKVREGYIESKDDEADRLTDEVLDQFGMERLTKEDSNFLERLQAKVRAQYGEG